MEALLEILSDLHPEIDFEEYDRLMDDEILDSFDIITIITEISVRFGVVINAEYIIPENFNSAELLWKLINRLEEED